LSTTSDKLLLLNELAVFVPCTAHSLNLVGVHAAETSPSMTTFFGSVQKIFVFFSSSTSRWNMLKNIINVTLKKHSDTRWSSKKQAISALHTNISIAMISGAQLSTKLWFKSHKTTTTTTTTTTVVVYLEI